MRNLNVNKVIESLTNAYLDKKTVVFETSGKDTHKIRMRINTGTFEAVFDWTINDYSLFYNIPITEEIKKLRHALDNYIADNNYKKHMNGSHKAKGIYEKFLD